MSSAPGEHAGLASAVNNDVARAAVCSRSRCCRSSPWLTGDAYLQCRPRSAPGFEKAVLICAALCWFGALIAAIGIRNAEFVAPEVTAADPRLRPS